MYTLNEHVVDKSSGGHGAQLPTHKRQTRSLIQLCAHVPCLHTIVCA